MRPSYLRVYDIRHHPKTRRLARKLEVDRATAVGLVTQLWMMTMSLQADEGDLEASPLGGDAAELAEELGWSGDPEQLVAALRAAGWLDGWTVHDWTEEQDARIAARELGRRGGKASGESRKKAVEDEPTQTSNSGSRSGSRSGSATGERTGREPREEKRREYNRRDAGARARPAASPAAASSSGEPASGDAGNHDPPTYPADRWGAQAKEIAEKLAAGKAL